MNYEEFLSAIKEKFLDYMPNKFKSMEVSIISVTKINVQVDELILKKKGMQISPAIDIHGLYKYYKTCGNLEEVLIEACSLMSKAFTEMPFLDAGHIFDDAKDKVIFHLINTEQNRVLLENIPHREFQDLSIVYRVIIKEDQNGIQSTKVTNELANRLGMNEEQLFKCAAENTIRLFPPTVRNMMDIMKDMFLKDGMPEETADLMIGEIPPKQTMWVISNNKGINGAVSMLYENKLHDLAEKIDSDLYIIPSSVHEVIAVSSEIGGPEEIAAMVAEINRDHVSLQERLSNQVYLYDRELRKTSLATDTPNKRIDFLRY